MKKSIINIITLALLVVNLILSLVMVFSVMPASNKANEMITKVCEAIDLDLNSGAATGLSNLPVDKMENPADRQT